MRFWRFLDVEENENAPKRQIPNCATSELFAFLALWNSRLISRQLCIARCAGHPGAELQQRRREREGGVGEERRGNQAVGCICLALAPIDIALWPFLEYKERPSKIEERRSPSSSRNASKRLNKRSPPQDRIGWSTYCPCPFIHFRFFVTTKYIRHLMNFSRHLATHFSCRTVL